MNEREVTAETIACTGAVGLVGIKWSICCGGGCSGCCR